LEVPTSFTFLLKLGVLVDQFGRHLDHWEGLMELQNAKKTPTQSTTQCLCQTITVPASQAFHQNHGFTVIDN